MAFANFRQKVGNRLDNAGGWIDNHRRVTKIGTAVSLVLILLAGISMMVTPWWKQVTRNTYIAYFPNTNGVYTGDEIRILGGAVGTIEGAQSGGMKCIGERPVAIAHSHFECGAIHPLAPSAFQTCGGPAHGSRGR